MYLRKYDCPESIVPMRQVSILKRDGMKMKKALKRSMAMLLAVVMTLSTVTFTWAEPAESKPTKTLGQLLTENYDGLKREEKDLLESGLLNEAGYTFTTPDANNGNGLVSIDAEKKTVTAKEYTNNGFTWVPVKAVLKEGDVEKENLSLTQGENGAYSGSFTYTGTSYGVAVTYEMKIEVAQDDQNKLLSAAAKLAAALSVSAQAREGVEALDEALQTKVQGDPENGNTFFLTAEEKAEQKVPYNPLYAIFAKINYGDGGGIPFTLANGKTNYVTWGKDSRTEAERALLKKLTDDAKDDGKLSALTSIWGNGGMAANSVKQSQNYAQIAVALEELYQQSLLVKSIADTANTWFDNIAGVALSTVNTIVNNLKAGKEFDWSVLNGLVKSDADAAALEKLVQAVKETSNTTASKDSLLADTTVVTANMAQATVNVVVKADVYNEGAKTATTLTQAAGTIRLAAETGKDELAQAIEEKGFVAGVLGREDWKACDVSEAYYDVTVTTEPEIPAGGLQDGQVYTYTITYTPKMFAVTAEGCDDIQLQDGKLPYGYNLTLPVMAEAEKVWDYTVNGEAVDQGRMIRITGETTISRVVGKAWENHGFGTMIAKNYAPTDAAVLDILAQSALSTGSVRLRTPENDDGLLTAAAGSEGGYTVTARSYPAGTGSLTWIPVAAKFMGKTEIDAAFTENGDGTYTAKTGSDFDSVQVSYRLTLGWDIVPGGQESAVEMLNLAYTLGQETEGQLKALNAMAKRYDQLGQVNDKLSVIKSIIADPDQGMKPESIDAITYIYNNCRDANGQLTVYAYVGNYKDMGDAAKMVFYYQNYKTFNAQLKALYENLVTISEDPTFNNLLTSQGYGEYIDKIDDIKKTMKDTLAELKEPNIYINTTAAVGDLSNLVSSVLEHKQDAKEYAASSVTGAPVLTTELSAAGIGKKTATVQVVVRSSGGDVKMTLKEQLTFNNDSEQSYVTLDDAKRNEIDAALGRMLDRVDLKHYERSQRVDIPERMESDLILTAIYTPKQYTVSFVDDQGQTVGTAQTFYYDNPVVTLPACGETGFRYDYSINGVALSATNDKYTFDVNVTGAMAFDTLFPVETKSCTITRTKVDTAREKLMSVVDGLNKAAASGEGMTISLGGKSCLRVAFIPYEKNGEITLVIRVAPATGMKLESAISGIAQEVLKYEEILLGSNRQELLANSKIDLQPVVDALLNSGLSLNTITEGVTESGDLVESAIPGAVMWTPDANNGYAVSGGYINDLSTIGLQLMQVPVTLDGTAINIAVTMEDFDTSANALKKTRDAASTLMSKGITVSLENGSVNLNAASEAAYKAIMGAALVLNQTKVKNLEDSNWNLKDIIPGLYEEIAQPIIDSETSSTTTIQNTLKKVGVSSVDVTKYQKAFEFAKYILKNSTFGEETGTDAEFTTTATFSMAELLGKISNEGLHDIVTNKLKSTDIRGKLNIGVTHTQKYAAAMLSAQKGNAGVKFISDSSDASFTVTTGNTIVVLMADSCKKITVQTGCSNVVIDLNGHSVEKVISDAGDRVIVVNSVLAEGGLASAGNAIDGAALAKKLYKVDRVQTANGENVVISLIPDVAAWKELLKTRRNMLAVAAEIVAEIGMNYGNASKKVSVNIGGQNYAMYDLALTDIAAMIENASVAGTGNDLLDCLKLEGINALANDMIRKLTDFEAISKAVEDGTDIISYNVTATGFGIETSVVTEGDYLNISTKDGTEDKAIVSIRVAKDEQYSDAIDRLQGILGVLKETVTVDDSTAVNIRDIAVAGTGDDVRFNADVDVNLKAKLDVRDDINYVILPAMIVANSLPSGDALKAELVNGIKAYLDKEGKDALKAAVERVSSRQLVAALKALNGKPIFAAQAKQLGLNVTIDAVEAGKMSAYGDILYMIGRAADLANINGNSGTIAGLKTENYGSYQLKYENKEFHPSRSVRMITGTVNAVANIVLDADVFTEAEDIVVKGHDGRYIYNGNDLTDALAHINEDAAGVTLVLNKAQSLTDNVKVNVPLTVTGKTLTMGSYRFILMNKEAAVTMTGITAEMVESNDPALYVTVSGNTASLLQYAAKANGEYCRTLAEAVTKLNGSGKLDVLTNVSMTDNIAVTGTMTVTGAANIERGGFSFVLKNKDSRLVSDAAVKAETDRAGYKIKETVANNTYTYTVVEQCVDKGDLYLDVRPEGINAAQLQTALRKILNKSDATVTVEAGGLTDKGLVRNGATVKVASGSDLCRYTIIIVGDTNCNGRTDSGDAVLMRRHFMNIEKLTGAALKAADVNKNGRIDSGDASKNRLKFMSKDWNGYKSSYENKVD